MATCMYLHFYVLLNLLNIYSAFKRGVCLHTALSFVTKYYDNGFCGTFYGLNVNNLFQEETHTTCHATCQIKLDYWYNAWNDLAFVSLEFDGYNYNTKTGCSAYTKAQLSINCSRWRKEQLGIIWSNNCSESHADCSIWFGFCICHCEPGYLMINGRCLRGNLPLNQSCTTTDQCLGSPYASCLGGKCSCIEGYDVSNSSYCVFSHQTDTNAIVQTNNIVKSSSTNIGPILGALLGGLLIGVVITAGFGFVTYKRFRSHIEQRKEPRVMFSMNDSYNRTKDDDILPHRPEEPYVHQDKQRRVVNVSPLTRSEDLPEYSNIAEKQNAMKVTDDLYNHLNEKEKTQDDDNYDHACAATTSGHANELSEYSNHRGLDCDLSAGMGTDDYSTLEHI